MDNKYAGMTVNERLCVSGLMVEFDEAVKQKNSAKVLFLKRLSSLRHPYNQY